MTHFAIAGLQLELEANNNLDMVVKKIRTTMLRFPFVQMVVLSELAICGANPAVAEPLPSPTEDKLCRLAKELGIWLVNGSLFEKSDDKVYNTTSVINPEGDVVKRYRKMYPFYPYESGTSEGQEICVFDIPNVGRFGVFNCYDMWFPELSRAMVTMGAEVLIHPSLTDTNDRDVEQSMIRATAAQQQCYMIDVNGAGKLGVGMSVFAGPDGDVMHSASHSEETIIREINLDNVRRTRERGLLGLGQTLKSFRDAGHSFPQEGMANREELLDTLGPLVKPVRGE